MIGLVSPDGQARVRLARLLTAGGFDFLVAADGPEALRVTSDAPPEAFVVDLQSSPERGVEVVRFLRAASATPIIGVLRRATPSWMVAALDAGADDVVAGDCGAQELRARIRAAGRRYRRGLLGDPPVAPSAVAPSAPAGHSGDRQATVSRAPR